MKVALLGPLLVDTPGGALGPRDRVILSALALRSGEAVSGEHLADALWGDEVPASWNKVVQGCVVRLRKALGPDAIETQPRGYRLVVPPDVIDVRRFERSVARARELLALGDPERAAYAADEALSLWRGRPFADIEEWEPARIEARRLDELRMDAEELRLDAALRAGRHREVLAAARAAVDGAPTRERRWGILAVAQYRSGGQGDALRTLHEARTILGRELGLEPGTELVDLEQAILRQDPALAPPVSLPEASTACPWPGLPAYGIDDAEDFFGRDDEVAACFERLASAGVLVVVGPSGSGKSSLVRAGLAADLRRRGRHVVVTTPAGRRPIDALTSALASVEPPVLVVDQCEEAAGPAVGEEERHAFFDTLVAHADRAPVVVALRADRVADVSNHRGFARLVERGLLLLGPMSESDLRAAIEGPARRAGLLIEPGLVDLVVRDVLGEPGALPLMSHALRQTWSRRQGRTLTVAAYRESGGIRGAVAQSAESVYAGIGASERAQLRELLLRLVSPGSDGTPSRIRMPRQTLSGNPVYERLIERLVSARLLTSDDRAVELAHDALARAWPRLRDWLEEDVEGARILRHLSRAATGWEALGRPDSELYRGVRLAQALEWRLRTQPELTAVELAFIESSTASEADNLRSAQSQIIRERRTVRRLRRLVVGVAIFAAIAAVASVVAVEQRDRAGDEARVAEARRLSAEALVDEPHDRALLLAVEAVRRWDSPETRGNLLATISRSARLAGVLRGDGPLVVAFEVTPDGKYAALVDGTGVLSLVDVATRAEVAEITRADASYASAAFSPDGEDLAVARMNPSCRFGACTDFGIDVLAASNLRPRAVTYEGLGAIAADVEYSPDGKLIAAVPSFAFAAPLDNVAVWRVGAGDRPMRFLTLDDTGANQRLSPEIGPPGWVAFSPDGARLYASGAGQAVAFDVATGEAIRRFDGRGGLALSKDGETIVIATAAGAQLVDTASGHVRAELTAHDGSVTAAAFSDDGARVATASNDETVVLWDAASGARLHVLEGHAGTVLDVAFSRDGTQLYSSATDRSLFLWDTDGSSGLARTIAESSLDDTAEGAVLVSPSGDSIAVMSERVRFVDVGSGRITDLQVDGNFEPAWGSYAPDGTRFVTVGWAGETRLWRPADGALLATAAGRADNAGAVAFTADGRHVLVADLDGTVREVSGTTLEPTGRSVDVQVEPAGIRAAAGGRFAVTSSPPDVSGGTDIVFGELAGNDDGRVVRRVHISSWGPRTNFSTDGSRYAFGGFDGRLGVIDVATGKVVGRREPVHSGPVSSVTFAPDGRTVASIGFDGDLTLSDVTTAAPTARARPGPANRHASVGYHPDGHTILVGYLNGSVLAYETDPDAWVEHACRVAGRNLSADEWRDAFGDARPRRTCPVSSVPHRR